MRQGLVVARRVLMVALLLASAPLLGWAPAHAVLELDITEGIIEPIPIAISEFHGSSALAAERFTMIVELQGHADHVIAFTG